MSTLGAFYMAYDNEKATNFVLQNFRKFYPESPVMLISDGGKDFSDLSRKYNTNFVKLDNIFYTPGIVGAYYDSRRLKELWRRHLLSVQNAKTDYIMILEDDVLVQGEISLSNRFSLKGVVAGNKMPKLACDIIQNEGGITLNDEYGACGGAVYNANDFLSIYDDAINFIDKNHDSLFFVEGENMNCCSCDCNLVFHFNRKGFKYEKAEWLGEYFRNPNWKEFPVVHQYKEMY